MFSEWTQGEIDAAHATFPNFFPLGGGALLLDPEDREIVGAIGISNRTQEQDDALVRVSEKGIREAGLAINY